MSELWVAQVLVLKKGEEHALRKKIWSLAEPATKGIEIWVVMQPSYYVTEKYL